MQSPADDLPTFYRSALRVYKNLDPLKPSCTTLPYPGNDVFIFTLQFLLMCTGDLQEIDHQAGARTTFQKFLLAFHQKHPI